MNKLLKSWFVISQERTLMLSNNIEIHLKLIFSMDTFFRALIAEL